MADQITPTQRRMSLRPLQPSPARRQTEPQTAPSCGGRSETGLKTDDAAHGNLPAPAESPG